MEARSILDQPDSPSLAQPDLEEHRKRSYDLWQAMAPRWERGRHVLWETTRPVSERLLDQLAPEPGQTILELAAGAGETGFLAAARIGGEGRLISSDFAPNMVEAAERVADELGITNAEFRVLDAENLELADGSVDGAICRWGYMLMGDPSRALAETRRVLRPSGRLAYSVFAAPEQNPWMTVARDVMVQRGHLPAAEPVGPGMFRLSDPDRIRALTLGAGFTRCELEETAIAFRFPDGDALWAFTSELQGPLALAIGKLGGHERDAVRAAMEDGYARFRVGGGYRIPGLALNVLAS